MEEEGGGGGGDGWQQGRLPFARGGPIYAPFFIGPLTSVTDFKASLLDELHSLQTELSGAGYFEDELSVDEIKIITEEELLEKAFHADNMDSPMVNESLLECENNGLAESSSVSGAESGITTEIMIAESGMTCNSDLLDMNPKNKMNRGRFNDWENQNPGLEGSCLARVRKLAKIMEKQEEDKLAARLHSFSGNTKPLELEGSVTGQEKLKTMKSLKLAPLLPLKKNSLTLPEFVPVCYPEVVLCVEIYGRNNSKKAREFLVLGRQLLTELRDSISCLTDKLMQSSGKHDPSGYFLIEGTFFNDMRSSSASDHSKPTFNWLCENKNEALQKWELLLSASLKKKQKELLGKIDVPNLPDFKAMEMQKTRFSDLRFRLGADYLYCHQGNCKHKVVIRDMRMFDPDDSQNQADYPLPISWMPPRYQKCSVCGIYFATKVTVNDKWAKENPCYFCANCYFLLHYKEDMSLLYPHTVFDYHLD